MAEIRVDLPAARPDDYLRWMAFWREVEQRMGESPALENLASAESAPFVHDEVAEFLASEVVTRIVAQAREASAGGADSFQPTIVVDAEMLRRGARTFALRTAWLTEDRCRAMGVEPLEEKLVHLRTKVAERVAQRLQEFEDEGS